MVCGRIKSDFRYQASVYNNFPWPQPAEKEKQRIAETAQGILDARSLYSNSCLADLYNPTFMPPELRKAHVDNDRAVMQAYGMPIKETDEAACCMVDAAVPGESKRTEIITLMLSGIVPGGIFLYLVIRYG